jgi:hypothetical protein
MEDEFSADYESDRHDYVVNAVTQAHMPIIGALLFDAWYSVVLASAMSLGVKYLHPETPAAHGILQSIAWALGSGIAIALASRMSKNPQVDRRYFLDSHIRRGLDRFSVFLALRSRSTNRRLHIWA